jgi:hypothetical protein
MKYSNKYLPHYLSSSDKKKQKRELNRSRKAYKTKRGKNKYYSRKKIKSYKSKPSSWTQKFHDKYPNAKSYSEISKVTGIPEGALKAVVRKGRGAYYSSGSRPNQTAESWGKARMYSYILGGKTRKIDNEITVKYNVKFKHHTKK